jgi:nitroreductase
MIYAYELYHGGTLMNEFLSGPVFSRRSIRRYSEKPVDKEQIQAMLSAAMCAPSADDERPWHFIVINDKSVREKLSELSALTHLVKDAPVAIVVCGDEGLQKQQGCWMLDCAASTENILVEAQVLGLGAVWLGIYPVEGRVQRARSILNVPENIIPFAIVAAGYPLERKEPAYRYDARRVHSDLWSIDKNNG